MSSEGAREEFLTEKLSVKEKFAATTNKLTLINRTLNDFCSSFQGRFSAFLQQISFLLLIADAAEKEKILI